MSKNLPHDPLRKLIEIMKRLKGPDGCPWDQLQTPESLKPYLLEEAYEVLHAIEHEEPHEIRNELGDLLLQIVFLASIYEEKKLFTIDDVADAISEKLIRRHPHVFGDRREQDLKALDHQWETIKREERQSRPHSLIESIPSTFPALLQAQKISSKVARVGFDWKSHEEVLDKMNEEVNELKEAIKSGTKEDMDEEFGDVLFTLVNIGRHLDIDSETALLKMVNRFKNRFQLMEQNITDAKEDINQLTIEELEYYWQQAKEIIRQQS